jgi:succinate-acetate transporter protein
LIVCGVLALYLVLAIVTNTMYGKSVFPVPPALVK